MILGSIHPPASGPALDGCTLAQALGSVLLDPVLPHTPVPGIRAYRYLGIIRLCGPSPQALTVSASLALLRAGYEHIFFNTLFIPSRPDFFVLEIGDTKITVLLMLFVFVFYKNETTS